MENEERRQQILEAIRRYNEEHPWPPTMHDIQKAIGVGSVSTVYHHMQVLKDRGLVTWEPTIQRTIRLVEE